MLDPTIPPPIMTTSAVCIFLNQERLSILAHAVGRHPGELQQNPKRGSAVGHVPRENEARKSPTSVTCRDYWGCLV